MFHHSVNLVTGQNTDVPTPNAIGRRLRLLVAIASFGEKNLGFLKKIIQGYRSMDMEVDVIVLSNDFKDLGPEVRVIVGVPTNDPWSLPFAHKSVLVDNVDNFDLFIYSEDDIEVSEKNIHAFLKATPLLSADEIAGFLRYETDPTGNWHIPEAHNSAHWKPDTVKRRGAIIVAEFSNEHSGFYILTQSQLKQAIASGNFQRKPCEGRYGLPETAATDPYTCCGFRKVICISALEDFLIHHLPNRYIGQLGAPLDEIKQQVHTLLNICSNKHPATTLCEVQSKILHGCWSKNYDEKPCEKLLATVPKSVQTLLSVGCGSGALEAELKQRGITVTALPLDSVIAVVAARLGIEIIYGSWDEGMRQLKGRKFDCVLISNLLHLQAEPEGILSRCARMVGEGGSLLVMGPNFNRIPTLVKRLLRVGEFKKLRDYSDSGINVCGPGTFCLQMKLYGLNFVSVRWLDQEISQGRLSWIKIPLGRLTARNWILQARSQTVSQNNRSV